MTSILAPCEEKLVGPVRVHVVFIATVLLMNIIAIEVVQALLEVDPSRRASVFKLEEMRWLRGVRRMIEL